MRQNKGFLELRRLEAARDIATLLSTSGNRVMLDAQTLLLNGKLVCAPNSSSVSNHLSLVTGDAKDLFGYKK
jgi:hypothetical protein